MVYFDYAATTPVDPECLKIYAQVSEDYWGNTSSLHDTGGKAQLLLENCRKRLGGALGVPPQGISFTSGGTEGNHLALLSLAFSYKRKGRHIIISGAEHSSLHSAAAFLEREGFMITKVPFTSEGLIDLNALEEAITDQTTVVSVSHVNGEIGSIQPLHDIKKLLHAKDILFHSDMVQSFGKLDSKEAASIVDSLTISSHKIYGPKGVGAVYFHPRSDIRPYMPHQTHEHGFRGGTVNLPGIAGLTAAALKVKAQDELDHYAGLRNHFFKVLESSSETPFTVYGAPDARQLPHIIGMRINGVEGQWLMLECNRRGIHLSTGSACQTGKHSISKTLGAMGLGERAGKEFVRISLGRDTTRGHIEQLAEVLSQIRHDSVHLLT
ncbi:IscS subfamily cysteine desulfurase [Bacillus haikouensis]|jgi:cysteine desulfurase|uniref:IscS subfamily cysteine desulfurase n=1 Tax=Bacillus haikouensis TaxID=1510468 RepID=UPI00155764BA|nr:IscS subfamily cysteine desulfurase [Bacillus haikouensis]NQD68016.1 IscS subfamily cysteine desulfurase [Bacillus haikouensis]